jgi:hypothetical protein
VDHANYCLQKAAVAPPHLSEEFERLAATWAQLAKDRSAIRPEITNVIALKPSEG